MGGFNERCRAASNAGHAREADVGKRLIALAIVLTLMGGAYAAGAVVRPSVTTVSGHRLKNLVAVSESVQQTLQVQDQGGTPTIVPLARLTLRVGPSEQGVFDVRFSGTQSPPNSSGNPQVIIEVRVDGVAAAPVGQVAYSGYPPGEFALERVIGPLAPGRHTVTVTVQEPYPPGTGTYTTIFDGWTLVAEEVLARP